MRKILIAKIIARPPGVLLEGTVAPVFDLGHYQSAAKLSVNGELLRQLEVDCDQPANTVSITAGSPENRPLTYSWTSSGGQLGSSGTSPR